ncbi:MAG TPA: DUF4197 domain-containing protein, partial [Chitinophagaceae bacterium]|nr:DUF4197 domain-containing protein [Chitinophagaceae bacterium]
SSSRLAGYQLTEADAAGAIRQMLEMGAREGVTGSFSREAIMTTLFPEPLRKTLNTLQQLGLSGEIDRFTTTLATAADKTATRSIPLFTDAIQRMQISDAIRIVRNGGTAGTDYLRSSVGDSLRRSIRPVVQSALDEYKLNQQWNELIKPAQAIAGNRLNLDLANLMAGMVSETMFRKIEERERQVRAEAAARTTPLLQRVFSRSW